MTATLDRPAAAPLPQPVPAAPTGPRDPWRERLQPLVTGSGGWLVTLAVTLVAGLLRFVRLDIPRSTLDASGTHAFGPGDIFDEVYYACDAHNLLKHGVELSTTSTDGRFCVPGNGSGAFIVHPPLGKWMIALGEQLFGFNTFGWRFMSAVAGTLTVLLVVRIGRRMTGSTVLGGLAGLLLAFDGLSFVMSRTALLDIFLCFWTTAAFGCLVVDRDKVRERVARATDEQLARGVRLGFRPWLVLSGVCTGGAVATKWSGLYYLVLLIPLAVFYEVGARRAAGTSGAWRRTLTRSSAPVLASLVVLPAALYTLSWTGWFATKEGWDRHWADGRSTSYGFLPTSLRSWWHYHAEILHFHDTLSASHPYQSHPFGWLLDYKPVSFYYPPSIKAGTYGCTTSSAANGCAREVLAIGTPALWWAIIPVAVALVFLWVGRRDWRAGALLAGGALAIVPWIPSDLHDRTMFLFYALPMVPFLCIGIALLAGWGLGRAGSVQRIWGSAAVGVYTVLVLIDFVYLYPVMAAVTLPYHDWLHRMWFNSWII